MATYSEKDIELIAAAIGQDSADVVPHEKLFEAAALWFRLSRGLPQALTVPKGHRGDMPLNDWIAAMLAAYKQITGKDPATSVGAPETDNEGVPGGPLLRYLSPVLNRVRP